MGHLRISYDESDYVRFDSVYRSANGYMAKFDIRSVAIGNGKSLGAAFMDAQGHILTELIIPIDHLKDRLFTIEEVQEGNASETRKAIEAAQPYFQWQGRIQKELKRTEALAL